MALVYSSIAGFATLGGIGLVLHRHHWAVRYSHFFNSFAAGALLTVAFIQLLPESVELSEKALLFVFLSFVVFYLLESAIVIHSGSEIHFDGAHLQGAHHKGPVIFLGLFVHSLIDGVIIGAGFEASATLGIFTALGVILHEFPEGVTTFALLLRSVARRRALALSLAVALATPVGAGASVGFMGETSPATLGALIALAAGSFFYVAASDLIPETHERNVAQNVLFFLAGGGFFYALTLFFE